MTAIVPEARTDLTGLTAEIVGAYVSNNSVPASELSRIIAETHAAISALHTGGVPAIEEKPTPAVSVKTSVTPDYIICLEDGKTFKSLKRHLMTHYDLTPEQYREKWGLPMDYPMVAPNYSAARSKMAKSSGLGRKRVVLEKPAPTRSRKKIGLKIS